MAGGSRSALPAEVRIRRAGSRLAPGERAGMAARKKPRPNRRSTRSRMVRRGVALGALALIGFFYYRPMQSYFATKHELAQRAAEVRALQAENRRLKRGVAGSETGPELLAEARKLGWIKPGERLFIIKGIDRWRAQRTTRARVGDPPRRDAVAASPTIGGEWMTAPSSSVRSAARLARSAASRCAARTACRRSPSSRPTARRRAVPDDVLPDLPAPRRRASRGWRRRAASSGGARRVRERAGAPGEPRARARRSSARCAASWPAARSGKDGGASLELGHRRLARARAASSACTRTPPSRWPGRATSSASGSWPSSTRSGPPAGAARPDGPYRRPRARRRRRARAPGVGGVLPPAAGRGPRRPAPRGRAHAPGRGGHATQLRRRVGQWFTLAELAEAYSGAEVWSRDAVADRAPFPGWVQTLSIVEGAAFHLYSRGAIDYRP